MGFFTGGKSQAELMADAEKIVAGKGLTGRLAKAFMGSDNMSMMQQSLQQANHLTAQVAAVQAMVAAGAPTITATVLEVADLNQSINDNPVVQLTAQLPNGTPTTMQTLVSRLAIPRVGDQVLLIENPATVFVYAGLAR